MDNSQILSLPGSSLILTVVDAWWCEPVSGFFGVYCQFNRNLIASGAQTDIINFYGLRTEFVFTRPVRRGTKFGRELVEPRITATGGVAHTTTTVVQRDRRFYGWSTSGTRLEDYFVVTWRKLTEPASAIKVISPILNWSSWPKKSNCNAT